MAEFDPDAFLKGSAPAAPEFDPDAFLAQPKSGGAAAAKELPREQEIRYEAFRKMMSRGEPGYTDRAENAVTSGVMSPIMGAMTAVSGKVGEMLGGKPATVGEFYRGGVAANEDFNKRAEDNTRGPLGTAVDLAGGLVSGGTEVKAAKLGMQALRAGVQGGIQGASGNSGDWWEAAKGAAKGAALNVGGTTLLHGLMDRFFNSGAKKDLAVASRQGSAQSVENNAGTIYDRLDNAGIHYAPKETASLAPNIAQRMAQEGFNPNMHSELIPALGEIGGTTGKPTTWKQLQNIQTQISDLKASGDPRMRRIAGAVDDEVQKWLNVAKPTMPAGSVAAGVNPTADLAEAKSLWNKGSRAADVEALNSVGTRLSPDPTAKVQQNFEHYTDQFVKDRHAYNPFAAYPEQGKIMDQIVEGSPRKKMLENLTDKGAKVLGSIGLGAAGTAIGAPLLGYDIGDRTSATAAGALSTAAALKLGSRAFRNSRASDQSELFDTLMRNIVTGSSKPAAGAYEPRGALAKLMATNAAARAGGNYAASFDTGMPQP